MIASPHALPVRLAGASRQACLPVWRLCGRLGCCRLRTLSCLLLALTWSICVWPTSAWAQIGEVRSKTEAWDSYAVEAQGFAFDNLFPGTLGPNGCLSPPGVVTLPLMDGSVQVSLSSGACPIRDESAARAISDAYVDNGTTLTFVFDPPIHAFYTTYGSVAVGRAMSMRVKSGDGRVDHLMAGLTSTHGTLATGHGFNSRVPIQRIEFTSSEPGTSVVGNFVGLAPEQDSLGNCAPAGSAASIPCDFLYAYGTTLPAGVLLQPDGGPIRDVDISGDTAVVGNWAGVNIFERNAGGLDNWGVVRKLVPPAEVDNLNAFGASLAIDGDWLVVGAPSSVESFPAPVGRAFIYRRTVGGTNAWGLAQTLVPTLFLQQSFGTGVGIDGNIIAVGDSTVVTDAASGFLEVFEHSGTVWAKRYTWMRPYMGVTTTGFGRAIAVSGDSVVVGEPRVGLNFGEIGGLAHMYTRSPGSQGTWTADLALASVQSAAPENQLFGASVAVLAGQPGIQDLVVVGMPQNPGTTPPLVPFAGAALGFRRTSGGWSSGNSQQRLYRQSPLIENAYHGVGVAIGPGRVYVSAPRSSFNPSTPPRRVFAYPHQVAQGSPVGSEIQTVDGLPLDDVSGPIAADGHKLLVAGRDSAAWILDFSPLFADGFEH